MTYSRKQRNASQTSTASSEAGKQRQYRDSQSAPSSKKSLTTEADPYEFLDVEDLPASTDAQDSKRLTTFNDGESSPYGLHHYAT